MTAVINRSGLADLSIVVQGPVRPQTPAILRTIRAHFRSAEIVLSTWVDTDTDGLDCDTVALSRDPGCFQHPFGWPINVNRMIVSTRAGLRAATGHRAIKTRTDVAIGSAAMAELDLRSPGTDIGLLRRIRVGSLVTRNVLTTFMPFHVGDIVQYGMTDDLRRWWNATLIDRSDYVLPGGRLNALGRPERQNAEQHLCLSFLNAAGRAIRLDDICDDRETVFRLSLETMLGILDVIDEGPAAIAVPAHIRRAAPPWQVHAAADFEGLRAFWTANPARATAELRRTQMDNRARVLNVLGESPAGQRFI